MSGRWSGWTSSAVSGDGRREQQVDARVVLDQDGLDQVAVDRGRGHDVDDALAIETQVEEDPVVAELEVAIDQAHLPAQLAVQRDGDVDRDGRGAHAALRPVEGEDAAKRRAGRQHVSWREPGQQALDAGQQLGRVERLDQVVVGPGTQAADLLLDLTLRREHDDRDVRRRLFLGPDLRGDLVAVELRQRHVEEDQVGRLSPP